MTQKSFAALVLLPLLAAGTVHAEDWYRIQTADGTVIGWQHESTEKTADGQLDRIERALSYRVSGHDRIAQRVTLETRRDSESRILSRRLVLDGKPALKLSADQTDLLPTSITGILAVAQGKGAAPFESIATAGRKPLVVRRSGPWVTGAWRVLGEADFVEEIQLGDGLIFSRSVTPVIDDEIDSTAQVPHAMVPSPFDVTAAQRRGHIRYRFSLPNSLDALVPVTASQRKGREGQTLTLDVCDTCGPGLSTHPDDLAAWTRPAQWLESDSLQLSRAVAAIRASKASGEVKMKRIAQLARKQLKDVNFNGHVTALAAWKRGSGDCTEDATLLAALARAAGIPARVASGLVYERERYHGARDAFLPHAWTVAYVDGVWRDYDISIAGFDSTHIAFAISDGEATGIVAGWTLAAVAKLDGMAEVRTLRPVP